MIIKCELIVNCATCGNKLEIVEHLAKVLGHKTELYVKPCTVCGDNK